MPTNRRPARRSTCPSCRRSESSARSRGDPCRRHHDASYRHDVRDLLVDDALAACTDIALPLMASTNRGFAKMAPDAYVAIAFVISSGVTSPEPSANELSAGSLLSMPSLCAYATMFSGPCRPRP